jgi:hypothetical protein
MKYSILFLSLILSACANDNLRILGGVKTEFGDENQIVLSYENAFEIGNVIARAFGIASAHCTSFNKKPVMKSKNDSGDFTIVMFACVD